MLQIDNFGENILIFDTSYDSKISFLEINMSKLIVLMGKRNSESINTYYLRENVIEFPIVLRQYSEKKKPLEDIIKHFIKNNTLQLAIY
jgi:hypothetical protein